jgi:hypothetical protein
MNQIAVFHSDWRGYPRPIYGYRRAANKWKQCGINGDSFAQSRHHDISLCWDADVTGSWFDEHRGIVQLKILCGDIRRRRTWRRGVGRRRTRTRRLRVGRRRTRTRRRRDWRRRGRRSENRRHGDCVKDAVVPEGDFSCGVPRA